MMSIAKRKDTLVKNSGVKATKSMVPDDRTKYCLEFNRGKCEFKDSHEGKLRGQDVFKMHICRKCLVNKGLEVRHAEKDCKA